MFKIKILTTGKIREPWLEMALAEYTKRLKPTAEIDMQLARDEAQLWQWIEKEPQLVGLDAQGKMMTSEQFSGFLHKQLQEAGSRLCFAIGGAEGFPEEVKAKIPMLSLSPLTFTHQMARLILLEQLYRAFEIAKGSPYHK